MPQRRLRISRSRVTPTLFCTPYCSFLCYFGLWDSSLCIRYKLKLSCPLIEIEKPPQKYLSQELTFFLGPRIIKCERRIPLVRKEAA